MDDVVNIVMNNDAPMESMTSELVNQCHSREFVELVAKKEGEKSK